MKKPNANKRSSLQSIAHNFDDFHTQCATLFISLNCFLILDKQNFVSLSFFCDFFKKLFLFSKFQLNAFLFQSFQGRDSRMRICWSTKDNNSVQFQLFYTLYKNRDQSEKCANSPFFSSNVRHQSLQLINVDHVHRFCLHNLEKNPKKSKKIGSK